jgi:hypothetical protein
MKQKEKKSESFVDVGVGVDEVQRLDLDSEGLLWRAPAGCS